MKKRLDVLLVERGLAESRSQAQALVLAGLVRGYDKPGAQVADDVVLDVERPPRFVSRGGEKLPNAIDALGVSVAGRDCA
jgi:23S rRNA (cytidine1920-2'-O)/16S rRNA (cytidine1409-2'-O)-methyltransferase